MGQIKVNAAQTLGLARTMIAYAEAMEECVATVGTASMGESSGPACDAMLALAAEVESTGHALADLARRAAAASVSVLGVYEAADAALAMTMEAR